MAKEIATELDRFVDQLAHADAFSGVVLMQRGDDPRRGRRPRERRADRARLRSPHEIARRGDGQVMCIVAVSRASAAGGGEQLCAARIDGQGTCPTKEVRMLVRSILAPRIPWFLAAA